MYTIVGVCVQIVCICLHSMILFAMPEWNCRCPSVLNKMEVSQPYLVFNTASILHQEKGILMSDS